MLEMIKEDFKGEADTHWATKVHRMESLLGRERFCE